MELNKNVHIVRYPVVRAFRVHFDCHSVWGNVSHLEITHPCDVLRPKSVIYSEIPKAPVAGPAKHSSLTKGMQNLAMLKLGIRILQSERGTRVALGENSSAPLEGCGPNLRSLRI